MNDVIQQTETAISEAEQTFANAEIDVSSRFGQNAIYVHYLTGITFRFNNKRAAKSSSVKRSSACIRNYAICGTIAVVPRRRARKWKCWKR